MTGWGATLLKAIYRREPGYLDNPVRQSLWRTGHAHAGVLVILNLVGLLLVDRAVLRTTVARPRRPYRGAGPDADRLLPVDRLATSRASDHAHRPRPARGPGAQRPRRDPDAAEYAASEVASVRDDRAGRVALMRSLYEAPPGLPELHLPYRRAALAFMDWQLRRGLLNALDGESPGSPWWRAVNERLLRDTAESRALVLGRGGPMSSPSVAHSVSFVRRPSARAWYRAHNATIVSAYVDHRELAEDESHVERFFINLVLVRVLYAHALVAAPRVALSGLAPLARVLGDPRLGMAGTSCPSRGFSPTTTPCAETSGSTWTPSMASVDCSTSA